MPNTRNRHRRTVVTSRLKAFQSFIDNFILSSGLRNGWKTYRGTWASTGTNATSTDAANTYPIIGVKMASPNTTVSAGVVGGTGLAFWISDANSWYATYCSNSSSTYNVCDQNLVENTSNPPSPICCSSTNSRVVSSYPCDQNYLENTSNPPSASCCSSVTTTPGSAAYTYYYTYPATYTAAYTYYWTYTAQWNPPYSYTYPAYWNPGYSYFYSYTYPATWTAPTPTTYSTYTATSTYTAARYCCSPSGYYAKTFAERTSGWQCPGNAYNNYGSCYYCDPGLTPVNASCYYPASTSYSCPSGGSYTGGGICTITYPGTAGGYSCPSGGTNNGTATCSVSGTANVAGSYSCPSGGSNGGTSTCTVSVAGSYSCPSGGSDLGNGTCRVTYNVPASYTCPSGGANGGTSTCTVTVNVAAVPAKYGCFTGTRTVNTTYYSCYTGNRSQTDYFYNLKVIQSVGGVVSSVGTDLGIASQPNKIKVVISNNSVVSTAYSDAAMTNSLGSRTDNFAPATKTGIMGIIKAPSSYGQGSTVTSFSATI